MIRVSDHAVLRYLQRVEGIDVDGVRERIAEHLAKSWTNELSVFAGSTPYRVKAGRLTLCVRGGVVTTCYPK